MRKLAIYSAVVALCAGCATTHQTRDSEPHATIYFVTRDARFSGFRKIELDGRTVPLIENVQGPFRIKPGKHSLVFERQKWVRESHPAGYWLSIVAVLLNTSSRQNGQVDWSGSAGEYSNYVENIEFHADVDAFSLIDCREFDGTVEIGRAHV